MSDSHNPHFNPKQEVPQEEKKITQEDKKSQDFEKMKKEIDEKYFNRAYNTKLANTLKEYLRELKDFLEKLNEKDQKLFGRLGGVPDQVIAEKKKRDAIIFEIYYQLNKLFLNKKKDDYFELEDQYVLPIWKLVAEYKNDYKEYDGKTYKKPFFKPKELKEAESRLKSLITIAVDPIKPPLEGIPLDEDDYFPIATDQKTQSAPPSQTHSKVDETRLKEFNNAIDTFISKRWNEALDVLNRNGGNGDLMITRLQVREVKDLKLKRDDYKVARIIPDEFSGSYRHWYGRLFGYNAKDKLASALKFRHLANETDPNKRKEILLNFSNNELGALEDSNLRDLINLYRDCWPQEYKDLRSGQDQTGQEFADSMQVSKGR